LTSGDTVKLGNFGLKTVRSTTLTSIIVGNPSTVELNFKGIIVGTDYYLLSFPDHGFIGISSITHSHGTIFQVTTLTPHGYKPGNRIPLKATNSNPSIDGVYEIVDILTDTMFTISVSTIVDWSKDSTVGVVAADTKFQLYRCTAFDSLPSNALNSKSFHIISVLDKNTLMFKIPSVYADSVKSSGGGDNCRISSALHGFAYTHSNTIDRDNLFRSIKLDGENYCLLTSPLLETMYNTGPCKNIFAKILLTEGPGSTVFNTYVPSDGKVFDPEPLKRIDTLHFEVRTPSNTLYEFNDMDFSFTLKINELIADSRDRLAFDPDAKNSQQVHMSNGGIRGIQRVHRN
jgi:hypothetical protein